MNTSTDHRKSSALLLFRNVMLPALALVGLLFFTGCIIADLDDDDGFGDNNIEVSQTFTIDLDVTTQVSLRLEGINGNVTVFGRPGASTLTVAGEKIVGSNSRTDAERRLDDLEVGVVERTDEFVIRTLQPDNTQGRNYVINYTITLPPDLAVALGLINGNVSVERLDNDVLVSNTNGNVELGNISGNAVVVLINGNILSEVDMPLGGAIELATTNGNIELDIPTTTSADFSARVTNGSISLNNLTLSDPVRTNQSLIGKLGDGDGTIELRTVNGNISVLGF